MAIFQYTGRNRRGEAVKGDIDATNIDAVATQLFNNGVTPIDIVPASVHQDVFAGLQALRARFSEGRIELTDQVFFCRQMYTLLKAGVPIMQALRGLRETTKNPALAKVIGSLAEGLDAGLSLSVAIKRHEATFSSLFVSMVQVGETTGSLPEAFLQLSQYLEREKDTRERIKTALRYPTMVIAAIGIAVMIINIFVIPAFANVFKSFKAELPWATKILIGTSDFTVAYWYYILAFLILVFVGVRFYIGTPEGRYRWHHWKLHIPLIGSIVYRAMLGRFARSLAVMLKAGVPLVQGMTVVSRALDNDYLADRILQMRDSLERGESIARTASATGLFPPMVLQMIAVGEDTGAIDALLIEVADYYEREVDHDLKNLSSSIEPILIVIMGIMVLILALGVFLPMWDLSQAARGR
jgi:MSHA biogenesis protein MshG